MSHTQRPPSRPAVTPSSKDAASAWRTALTLVEPNRICVRGYALDEAMGRLSFGEAVYLLLVGELPTPTIGRLMEALLVSSIDHGTTPPSTNAARNVATSGAPLRASVAAGVLAFGEYHGGDIEACMHVLARGLALVRDGRSYDQAATTIVAAAREAGEAIPGFGHRLHTEDPRTARLFQMALELELDGPHVQMIRAIDRVIRTSRATDEPHRPINVDGAIAAVSADLGLDTAIGNAIFIISRVAGLIGHAREEAQRQRPMRSIDPTAASYDGPRPRRFPERRQ
ncbi:MAG: citryl-CoA lyase [Vicinamibacterales bacterium]